MYVLPELKKLSAGFSAVRLLKGLDEAEVILDKLCDKVVHEDQLKVLHRFMNFIEWSSQYPDQAELIRERITQIATRNFVNNTPQFVLPELEKFLEELKTAEQSFRAAQAVPEGDEYAMAKPTGGLIIPSAVPIAQINVNGPFNSVEEALEAYRAVYLEIDTDLFTQLRRLGETIWVKRSHGSWKSCWQERFEFV
jgi:RecB family endonuclease NucS